MSFPTGSSSRFSVWQLKPWAYPGQAQLPTFYYLTGLERQIGGVLALDAPSGEAILFAPGGVGGFMRSMGVAVQPGEQAATDLRLDDVRPWEELKPWLDARTSESPTLKLYIEGQLTGFPAIPELPVFAMPAGAFHAMLESEWPDVEVETVWRAIDEMRAIKSSAEIETIRRARPPRRWRDLLLACEESGLAACSGTSRPRSFRRVWRLELTGCRGGRGLTRVRPLFSPHTFEAFADYRHLNRRMESGEVARIDVGCEVDHYHSDVGRTATGFRLLDRRPAGDVGPVRGSIPGELRSDPGRGQCGFGPGNVSA